MNVLHVVNIYFVLPFFIGDQFKYFKRKGYGLNVVCSPSEYLADYAKQQGFDYLETPVNRSISIKDDILSVYNICKYIKNRNIDVIVGHTPKGGLLAMISGYVSRVPKRIYFRHGLVYETSHGLKRFLLKTIDKISSMCATQIVCVSPSVLKRSIEDHLAPSKKQKILYHGTCNGVDTQGKFNPANIDQTKLYDLRNKYGIKPDDFVIGYSGRLVKDKGIEELVKAFNLLNKSENCKLLLVGMYEERDALSEDVKTIIRDNPRIILTGFINGGMEYFYSMMDMYVLASYREGFPTGVLEAQSMEKPVVTTRVTGCCDSIVDNVTGIFADNTPEDLAQKINEIRINKKIDGRLGRKWVVENFDSRIIWKEIEKLLNE